MYHILGFIHAKVAFTANRGNGPPGEPLFDIAISAAEAD